ncbi:virulence factor BrkB-domain-containing protein [Russula earlei]|uniref:Virulence factor BrkB-domain-containing protein n=1 Tax=Russula earlei TaxID=71964 RepID=A0ACC0TWL0_9AGAM|nr:virulence factor BrkB-domain-containing protein [Russula earlei]
MALPAAVLFVFSIIPYLPDSASFKNELLGLFKDITPNSNTYKLLETLLNDLLKKHVGVFSFGFVLLMFYSSNAMMGIIRTFDRSVKETKAFFLHKRWRAIRLTTILILLLIASSLVLIGQQQLAGLLRNVFHAKKTKVTWWNSVRWIVIVAFLYYGIAFIYKFAPSVKKRWALFSPGAVLATALILLATVFFSFWVNNFAHYNKVYGSIGTVLILMILIYFNSLILLIGFELNVSIMYLEKEKNKPPVKTLMAGRLVAQQNIQSIAVGSTAPLVEVMMKDVSGKETSIKQSIGKNGVLVMFSCNTCPVVVKNQQRTKDIAAYAKQHNIGVIVINSNEAQRSADDSYAAMQTYAKQQGYTFSYVVDKDSKIADAYGASHTPEIFLVSNDGKIIYKGAIDDNPTDPSNVKKEYLKEAIDEVASGKPIAIKESKSIGCSIKRVS